MLIGSTINFCKLCENATRIPAISLIKIELKSDILELLKKDKDKVLTCLNNLILIFVIT